MSRKDRFLYVHSCDLDEHIEIKIGTLEGEFPHPDYTQYLNDPLLHFTGASQSDRLQATADDGNKKKDGQSKHKPDGQVTHKPDLFVTCQVYSNDHALTLPVQTAYKSFTQRWSWNEWVQLPVKFSECPLNSQLAITIWDVYGTKGCRPVAGTTISLFNKMGMFRRGVYDLRVWPNTTADGRVPSKTPGKSGKKIGHMNKLLTARAEGRFPEVDWLDRLALRQIEMKKDQEKRETGQMYLLVEMPKIYCDHQDYAVVYFEQGAEGSFQFQQFPHIVVVPDPEVDKENLVENKHHKLVRALRSGPTDRGLRPNAATRNKLQQILDFPPTKVLTSDEKDLVWRFRFHLQDKKQALTKFLKSVNWSMDAEVRQALELLATWAEPDASDALELLSPSFTSPAVRKYAVAQLSKADDEELQQYLLQLVQALRYENQHEIVKVLHEEEASMKQEHGSVSSGPEPASPSFMRPEQEESVSTPVPHVSLITPEQQALLEDALKEDDEIGSVFIFSKTDLATFLIERASNNHVLCSYFNWYLKVEIEDHEKEQNIKESNIKDLYQAVRRRFEIALKKNGREGQERLHKLQLQHQLMDRLKKVIATVNGESGGRPRKIQTLKNLLRNGFEHFESPIPLPLDPRYSVVGIDVEKANLFKSNLMPCKLTFKTTSGESYVTIFKHGDDLRQDQLVLQIITLIDQLLKRENVDLKLTPYKVLATSTLDGFVQFIDSMSIHEVLNKHDSILNFFRHHAPSSTGPYGVHSDVINNFVTSCAGYCVITYILGVGDRHLDNLLLTTSGKLFHIDFGYLLGRDPKPMPPPMKLSSEIIDGMGGQNSDHFRSFQSLCYDATLRIKMHASILLNLFSLMVDANIPDIALEPDKTVQKVQEKLSLDRTDEETTQFMKEIIDASASATMAAFMERMHKLAQVFRS